MDQGGERDESDVQLVGFSARQQSTRHKGGGRPASLSRNSKSTQDITYTLNGQPLSPKEVADEKVTLVGFSPRNSSFKQSSGVRRCESFAPNSKKKLSLTSAGEDRLEDNSPTNYSPYCTNTLKTSKELKMERERLRQEKLSQFTREAQNWRKQAENESKTAPGSGADSFDDPFFAAFDKMMGSGAGSRSEDFMKFFSEVEKRFASRGSGLTGKESYSKFFTENRERFAEMREEMRKKREESFLNRTSDFSDLFEDWKRPDLFSNARSSFDRRSERSEHKTDQEWASASKDEFNGEEKTDNFRRSFSSSSGFDSCSEGSTNGNYGPKYNPRHTHFGSFGFSSPDQLFRKDRPGFATKFTTTFNGCTRFTPIIVSPPGNRGSRMGYQIKTHRSTFEYCGNTKTYKFSTEQTTHSFNENGSAVSESEESEDEEEEPGRKNSLAVLPANGVMVSSAAADSKLCPTNELSVGDTLSVAAPSEVDSCTEGISPNNSVLALEYPDPKQEKSYNIALELLTTEKTYVDVLHLIDQVFFTRVKEENETKQMFPPEILPQIFSNAKSLYKFHHDFLLPKLKERMENWDSDPRIGDIMKDFAPFLKMYTEYVKNFDHAMNLINNLIAKNSRFAAIIDEIQQMPECGNLTLQHHMLSPIQRLPRYQLLLQDYLRRLPEHSSDRDHTEKALHLVSVAAMHANDAMRKIDQFKQLLEIQDRLGGVSTIDLVSPSRALVREGKVTKISARSGDHQERYLFLFTDLVLLCSTRRLPVGTVTQYRLRAQFPMAGLQVLEGDNLETPNTFYLSDGQRTIELYTSSVDEKEAWVISFVEVIEDLCNRKSSLRLEDGEEDSVDACGRRSGDSGIGDTPPTLLRMDGVGKCMDCGASFTFKRKHHCHGCGIIVCSKCSNQKAPLKYNSGKESRICKECYRQIQFGAAPQGKVLTSNGSTSTLTNGRDNHFGDGESPGGLDRTGPRLLDVPANSPCIVSGYLNLKSVRGKTWAKRWFVLHPDGVLFSYKLPSDDRALTATPVPGYSLAHGPVLKGDSMVNEKERDLTFKMHSAHKAYYFQAETKSDLLRWVTELQDCVANDVPGGH